MKKINQSGFSIIEALLILVVIGILGFTGWYVYHTKQAANKNYSVAARSTVPTYTKKTTAKAPVQKTVNSYTGWTQYCSSLTKLCVNYPQNWANYTCPNRPPNTYGACPSGNFSIVSADKKATVQFDFQTYNPQTDVVSATCNPNVNNSITVYFKEVKAPNLSDVFLVDSGVKSKGGYVHDIGLTAGQSNGQPPVVGQPPVPSLPNACPPISGFDFLTSNQKYWASFNATGSESWPQYDVATVESILLSATYQN